MKQWLLQFFLFMVLKYLRMLLLSCSMLFMLLLCIYRVVFLQWMLLVQKFIIVLLCSVLWCGVNVFGRLVNLVIGSISVFWKVLYVIFWVLWVFSIIMGLLVLLWFWCSQCCIVVGFIDGVCGQVSGWLLLMWKLMIFGLILVLSWVNGCIWLQLVFMCRLVKCGFLCSVVQKVLMLVFGFVRNRLMFLFVISMVLCRLVVVVCVSRVVYSVFGLVMEVKWQVVVLVIMLLFYCFFCFCGVVLCLVVQQYEWQQYQGCCCYYVQQYCYYEQWLMMGQCCEGFCVVVVQCCLVFGVYLFVVCLLVFGYQGFGMWMVFVVVDLDVVL